MNTVVPLDVAKDIYGRIKDGLSVTDANALVAIGSKIQKDPKYKPGYDVINDFYKGMPQKTAEKGAAIAEFYKQVDICKKAKLQKGRAEKGNNTKSKGLGNRASKAKVKAESVDDDNPFMDDDDENPFM